MFLFTITLKGQQPILYIFKILFIYLKLCHYILTTCLSSLKAFGQVIFKLWYIQLKIADSYVMPCPLLFQAISFPSLKITNILIQEVLQMVSTVSHLAKMKRQKKARFVYKKKRTKLWPQGYCNSWFSYFLCYSSHCSYILSLLLPYLPLLV